MAAKRILFGDQVRAKALRGVVPVQVTYHGIQPSPALDEAIRQRARKLERFHKRLVSCRATVEQSGMHQGRSYTVRLDIRLPGTEIAISHDHDRDPFVAVHDAFDAAWRRIEDHARKERSDVKREL